MFDSLTQQAVEFYRENGFVQINQVLSTKELEEIRENIEEAMAMSSQRAFQREKGSLYYRVLNQKVNTWRDSGAMAKFAFHAGFAEMARQLSGVEKLRFFHDHALLKMPGDSKETPWHQDLPYWPFHERRALSIWIALDDVDETNGCLTFIPGSHKVGKLKGISLTKPEDIFKYVQNTGIKEQHPVRTPLKAGSCTFHNGLTFHYAHSNTTQRPRRAYAIIYVPDGTVYTGKDHVVTDGTGLQAGQPLAGGLFPIVAGR